MKARQDQFQLIEHGVGQVQLADGHDVGLDAAQDANAPQVRGDEIQRREMIIVGAARQGRAVIRHADGSEAPFGGLQGDFVDGAESVTGGHGMDMEIGLDGELFEHVGVSFLRVRIRWRIADSAMLAYRPAGFKSPLRAAGSDRISAAAAGKVVSRGKTMV
jgi:hypothetical protein